VQSKRSVLFGAISIVVVGVILVAFVLMPQSASQAHTDMLQKAVDRASRGHNQALGLMASPTVTVNGKLPPTFDKGNEANIAVLEARQQNTVIPVRLDELRKELKAALDKTPKAKDEAKAAAYALMGQIMCARAQYYLQSAANAAVQAGQAMAAIDSGIVSIQEHLTNLRQIAPLTEAQETVATKMKTDADDEITRIESAIATQTEAITKLETERAEYLDKAAKYSNEASELRARSVVAQRDERRELQEQSFVKEKIANKAGQDAEDAQTKIDQAKSTVAMLNIELTAAKSASDSAAAVLKGLADNRGAAKGELDRETLAINEIAKEIAKNADALIVACAKVDAAQVSVAQQYTAALEATKQFKQHVLKSSVEAISSEGGVMMDKAWASVAVVSWRKAVDATGTRLKALWETAALEGDSPKAAEMAAFAGKVQTDETAAAESFAAAAKLYEEATTKVNPRFKWSYENRELKARRARHQLTGDADDNTRADLLEQALRELEDFPYVNVDGAL
jgi:chromosome segregation ATPase